MESIIFKTLLHSLWQGVLLAVLTALIVLFTTKSDAKVRYNLFVGCLLLFVAGVGTTFFVELNSFVPSSAAYSRSLGNPVLGDTLMEPGVAQNSISPKVVADLIGYLSKYSSTIVLIWFLIICAKSIRFMVDIRTLMQVRTNKVYYAGKLLTDKVNSLAVQYGIKQTVHILQSGMIKVPMVLGHFKPLILVPLGLINGLSAEEVDAILSHEMAHIKRKDYLVNLLQSTVEILFFFNPAVLWVSNMIKTERENCCDDLAVSSVETKIDYIKALVSCQQFAAEMPAYVMAVNGGKGSLVHRVQRLVSSKNKSLNKMEKVIIGLVLISSLAITSAFSGKEAKPLAVKQQEKLQKQQKLIQSERAQLTDYPTEPAEPKLTQQHTDNADAFYAQLIREGLAKSDSNLYCTLDNNAFVINGVRQSAAIHKKYASVYLKPGQIITYNFKASKEKEHREVEVSIGDRQKANDATAKEVQSHIKAQISSARAEQSRVADAKSVANANAAQATAAEVEVRAAASARSAQVAETAHGAQAAQAAQASNAQVQAKKGNDMTSDLVADGIIKDKKNLSYTLNIDELVVDDVKQPDAVHRKYMRKYLKTAKQKISVSVSTN